MLTAPITLAVEATKQLESIAGGDVFISFIKLTQSFFQSIRHFWLHIDIFIAKPSVREEVLEIKKGDELSNISPKVFKAGLESIQLIYLSYTVYISFKINKYNTLQNIYLNLKIE